jgi:hypothetical protein
MPRSRDLSARYSLSRLGCLRVEPVSAFGGQLKNPPGDNSLMSASRSSPLTRTLWIPSGGLSPHVRFATVFASGECLKNPPGDNSLMSASRPSPLTRTGNYGDNRIRTGDPLLAKQVLYQLSYVPLDNQKARAVTDARSTISPIWWAREDLNLRPHAYQACALTN